MPNKPVPTIPQATTASPLMKSDRLPTQDELPPFSYEWVDYSPEDLERKLRVIRFFGELPEGAPLPTQYELPCDDGLPLETQRHAHQMNLLLDTLAFAWEDRDYFAGGDMFVYFDRDQLMNRFFRGPDVFVVMDVPRGERRCWVVWDEGKAPDLVIELLSLSSAKMDRGEKKRVYQDELKVPIYIYYDPWFGEMAGFELVENRYVPLKPDSTGRWFCRPLGLNLVRWHGVYLDIEADWLRWEQPGGTLLPTPREYAEEQRALADKQRARADTALKLAEVEHERAELMAARLRELGYEP